MRVVILGAGLMGVTTAWELLRDGHEVVVIERNATPAEETSAANAGLIAPGHAFAWASPRVPGILLKSLYRNDQAFRIRFNLDRAFWSWTLRFLGQCTAARARANTARKHALCTYSQARMREILAETGIEYHRARGGLLYLYRSEATLARGAEHMRLLADLGQELTVLDRDQVAQVDPAYLPVKHRIAGAIHSPGDESGDSRAFALALAARCAAAGARFVHGETVTAVHTERDLVTGVATASGGHRGDAYVLALGPHSATLARTLGDALRVYPVKGYSMTVPVNESGPVPRLGAVDEDNLAAWCRMGPSLRVTAVAEFAGFDLSHRAEDFASMRAAVSDLLPQAADYARASYRACLRPMTPRGTPVFGRGRMRNLYYNTGQGHMGWTMACGSARIAADLLAGREPAIDLSAMRL